jgi:hypothetical protein
MPYFERDSGQRGSNPDDAGMRAGTGLWGFTHGSLVVLREERHSYRCPGEIFYGFSGSRSVTCDILYVCRENPRDPRSLDLADSTATDFSLTSPVRKMVLGTGHREKRESRFLSRLTRPPSPGTPQRCVATRAGRSLNDCDLAWRRVHRSHPKYRWGRC